MLHFNYYSHIWSKKSCVYKDKEIEIKLIGELGYRGNFCIFILYFIILLIINIILLIRH